MNKYYVTRGEYYPFHDITTDPGSFDVKIKLTKKEVEWIIKTLEDFELVQVFLRKAEWIGEQDKMKEQL